ncbi:MAG: hypothetical protein LBV55_03300 [Acholeplasmatales bacterium]|jgi:Na+-driven multidrug efflux pump|nr:hypothetical protein [Acholeplasmatales bacterium]
MSDKTLKKREYILNGNLLKVILMITAPLALYAIFNYLYGIIDLALVLPGERAQVVFYDEMKTAITAFGAGIATAGSVIVGRLYGAGDIANARKNAGVTLWLNIIICTAIAVVVMAVAPFFFNVIKISDNILDGISYFYVQIITTIAMAVTATFVGMEKVKGNTLLIFLLNIGAMVIKILLTILLVNVLHLRATFAAVSTLIAQVILMSVALVLMFKKSNILLANIKNLH